MRPPWGNYELQAVSRWNVLSVQRLKLKSKFLYNYSTYGAIAVGQGNFYNQKFHDNTIELCEDYREINR